jgi:hypothetical protein
LDVKDKLSDIYFLGDGEGLRDDLAVSLLAVTQFSSISSSSSQMKWGQMLLYHQQVIWWLKMVDNMVKSLIVHLWLHP